MYPNPSNGFVQLTIKAEKPQSYRVQIHNVNGIKVYEKEAFLGVGEQTLPLQLQHLAKGLYLLKLSNAEKVHHASKLIIH